MSAKTVVVSKRPDLITTVPSDNTYKNLSENQLLSKVKLLHEQLLKTNRYLMDVHRMSIYNWDSADTGNIIVSLPENQKGFLLDHVLRLRGNWDPSTNTPTLLENDPTKIGWLYKVSIPTGVCFGISWKKGDYALYDDTGQLYNVQAAMLENLFTPIIPIESDTVQIDTVHQDASGVQLRAHVKIDPTEQNDLQVSARGIYSNAYAKAFDLITVQETPPTSHNLDGGLRIVYLKELPTTFYDGWLYLIPPTSINIEN